VSGPPPLAHTQAGRVAGQRLGSVDAFLGLPYAAPPVGGLRWRPPQPVAPWTGVRPAQAFAPSAWQVLAPEGFGPWTPPFMAHGPVGEDCLYLNVWAPAVRRPDPAPVLVWLHGGAFVQGSAAVPVYDGHALAMQGIVVVSVNYRLGVFGFLAHPEMAQGADGLAGAGNFGLQDQLAALRWVQDNIAAFGGDPGAVTLAGQSAGAVSVHMLSALPAARGLLHRAIALSGPPELLPLPGRVQAEQQALAFAAELRVPDLAALRALSVPELTRTLGPGPRFGPVVGGPCLPSWPPYGPAQGHSAPVEWAPPVPTLASVTVDENSGLDPQYAQAAPQQRAEALERWLAATWQWAALRQHPAGEPVYAALFAQVMPGAESPRWGAFHTSDVPYALGNLATLPDRTWTETDHRLSACMVGYWSNFVRHGHPNGDGLPAWPALDVQRPELMRLAEQPVAVPMFAPGRLGLVQGQLRASGVATVLG